MECFVYNWRILLGGAASAAILTAGFSAPAFAQAQDAPASLSGLASASGVLCGLRYLPVSGEISAAANVIGVSCGTSSSSSSSSTTGSGTIQANGPMRASGAASSSLPGLNSVSGPMPAAGAAPGVAKTSGTPGNSASASTDLSSDGSSSTSSSSTDSSTGLGLVTGTLSGVTSGLLYGGSISTPLSGVTGG
jgi:hypothetical protein